MNQLCQLEPTQWLTDLHIEAAFVLLRTLDPEFSGLFNMFVNGYSGLYPPAESKRWVQILQNGENHWLLSAFGFSESSSVMIYDSLNAEINDLVKASIASLLKTRKASFSYYIVLSSKQENWYDCGVYAIANATSILLNQDPSQVTFDPAKLRAHFLTCLKNCKLSLFPTVKSPARRSKPSKRHVVKVYCLCRCPNRLTLSQELDDREKMVQCDAISCNMWYHKGCLGLEDHSAFEEDRNLKWICPKCR